MASFDIRVKELEKRASGQAFELILSPRTKESVPDPPPSKKKNLSLKEIQKRLEAAKERRKSHKVLKQLAEKQKHEKEKCFRKPLRRTTSARWRLTKRIQRRTWLPSWSICERRTSTLKRCRRTKNPKTPRMRPRLTGLFQELTFSPTPS